MSNTNYIPPIYVEPLQHLFTVGTVIPKREFLQRIDMAGDVPMWVRYFWHIAPFSEVVIDSNGNIEIGVTSIQVSADD